MKLLFVIEHFYPFHDASARVLKNLLSSSEFKDHEIHVVSLGDRDLTEDSINIHTVPVKNDIIFKLKNKFLKGKYVKNKEFIKRIKQKIELVCDKHNIDHVLYIIGNMNLLLVNPSITTKQSFIFYDSLLNNFFYRRERNNYISKIQSKAFQRSTHIFLLDEYLDIYKSNHKEFVDKFHRFYITAFYNNEPIQNIHTNTLLHAGAFFVGLREPNTFFKFLDKCDKSELKLKAITLGALPKALSNVTIPKNLEIKDRVFDNEYKNLVMSCECFVLVDNYDSCNQIPSKTYEYIGYNKKILFFTSGNTNTAKILSNNKNVFLVKDEINDKIIELFNIFLKDGIYDERQKYYMNEKDYAARHLLGKLL